MRRTLAIMAAVAIAASALSGCSADPPRETPGLTVKVFQYRSDYAPRQLQLEVSNTGKTDIRVTSARFVSTWFASTVSSGSAPSHVIAGSATDFPVILAEPRCDAPNANARVLVSWTTKDGSKRSKVVLPTDPFGSLKTVHAQDCGKIDFEKVATITPATSLRFADVDGKQVALLDLAITPTGAPGSVTLASTQDTTLLAQREGQLRTFDTTFDASTSPAVITLDFVPSRCEQHVIAEDKVGTLIPVHAVTARYPEAQFLVPVSTDVKYEFYDWFARYCGWS